MWIRRQRPRRNESRRSRRNHRRKRRDRHAGKRDAERANRANGAIQQHEREDPHARADDSLQARIFRERRPQVAGVMRESDVAAGKHERGRKDDLPRKQERKQSAPALPSERFAQKHVRAARARVQRAELRPGEAVAKRDDRACDPGYERRASVQICKYERNRNQRPDADHRDDVHRHRAT